MPKHKDLTGQRFGRLAAVCISGSDPITRAMMWECRCDCGRTVTTRTASLTTGKTKSCGCLHRDAVRISGHMATTHGHTSKRTWRTTSPEYATWARIKRRCANPNDSRYAYYGGRGIAVCERWLKSFECFLADMGPRPSQVHSIERRDSNKGYSPDNCCWAVKRDQANNTRKTIWMTWRGQTWPMSILAAELGMSRRALYERYRRNRLPAGVTLSTPA